MPFEVGMFFRLRLDTPLLGIPLYKKLLCWAGDWKSFRFSELVTPQFPNLGSGKAVENHASPT